MVKVPGEGGTMAGEDPWTVLGDQAQVKDQHMYLEIQSGKPSIKSPLSKIVSNLSTDFDTDIPPCKSPSQVPLEIETKKPILTKFKPESDHLKRHFAIETSCVYFIQFLLRINMVIMIFSRKSSVTSYLHFSLRPPKAPQNNKLPITRL